MRFIPFVFAFFAFTGLYAQGLAVRVEPVQLPYFTGIQSFAWAVQGEYLIMVGGRLDGLHKRRPFESFLAADNNAVIYVYNLENGESMTADVTALPWPYNAQLQSTNLNFFQDGDQLILVGGYGYNDQTQSHTTYPYITSIDLPCLIVELKGGASPRSCFSTLEDDRMAVTGGQLNKLEDGRLYLVGGQFFDGLYNPMGPTHGPGFTQVYTDEVRRFRLERDGGILRIADYEAWHDELNLHRRDYNMTKVRMADGSLALIAFSGVFQHMVDLPFLNAVVIDTTGYVVDNDFTQYFNQYHTAHVTLHDAGKGESHVVFLGGIAQFYLDANGQRVEDQSVPFVKTISAVTRTASGDLMEWTMQDTMPGYLGAGAEFIPNREWADEQGIIGIEDWESGKEYLLGYLIGGIDSDVANGFFLNGDYSSANTVAHAVYGSSTLSSSKYYSPESNPLELSVWPNPASSEITVDINVPDTGTVYFYLQDIQGRIVYDWESQVSTPGKYETTLRLPQVPPGQYLLGMSQRFYMRYVQLTIAK